MSASFPTKVLLTHFDWYVAISRGGLLYAFLLAQITGQKNIDTVVATSYDDNHIQQQLKITPKDYSHLRGCSVLLIDDLSDSGNTFLQVSKLLTEAGALVKTFAFIQKEGTAFKPDFVCKHTPKNQWITFTYDNFKPEMLEDFVLSPNDALNKNIHTL